MTALLSAVALVSRRRSGYVVRMSSVAAMAQPVSAARGRMSVGAWLLAAVLLSDVAGWVIFRGDAARAVLITTLLLGGLGFVILWAIHGGTATLPRLGVTQTAVLLAATLIGGLGFMLAVLWHNDPYYVAADLYHWFVEGLVAVVVTAAILGRGTAQDAARAVAVIGLLVGAVCVAVFVLGTFRVVSEGTHYVNNLGIARLIVGRGTPQVILLAVVAAAWRADRWDRATRLLLALAIPLLLFGLAVTLKRTLWLSFPIAAACAVLPRKWLAGGAVGGALLAVAALVLVLALPRTTDRLLTGAAGVLTYNPGFTVQETLARRSEQLGSVWPYIVEHPYGHGLGASVFAYWTRGQTYADVHYIHNLYAYYALQIGVVPTLLLLLLAGLLMWRLARQDDRADDWGFAARAGLAGLVALLINGVSLVPNHTFFAGFVVGLGMIGSAKLARKERGR